MNNPRVMKMKFGVLLLLLAVFTMQATAGIYVEKYIQDLKDPNPVVREYAAERLYNYIQRDDNGTRALDSLIQVLDDENLEVRLAAIWSLGYSGDIRAVDPLIQVLHDNNSNVREQAARSLGWLGDAKAMDPLIQVLHDNNLDVRRAAVVALGDLHSNQAVESLIHVLRDYDEDPMVRKDAAESLYDLNDTRAMDTLIQLYNDDYENWYVRLASYDALEKLGWQASGSAHATNKTNYIEPDWNQTSRKQPDPIAYVLELDLYKAALLGAEEKNPDVDYAKLQEGAWTLAYNPATKDAYFIKRFELSMIENGYLEAFPLNTILPLSSRSKVIADLQTNGWPEIGGV